MSFGNLQSSLQAVSDELHSFSSVNQLVGLRPSDVLVCWFVCAMTGAQPSRAQESLTGGSGDRALDAIYIDGANKNVLVVQGKLRESASKREKRESVEGFASWAPLLSGLSSGEHLDHVLRHLHPGTRARVDLARKAMDEGFRLEMAFVTTGRVSDDIKSAAELLVREKCPDAQFTVYDGALTLSFVEEWRDDVVPVIPFATLRLENYGSISHSSAAGVRMRVAVVRGEQVADLYRNFGQTIFTRNIRGYQGKTSINEDIEKTIKHDPKSFLHLNNGITIVCSDLQVREEDGYQKATIRFPQIINGQQTTRTLSAVGKEASETLVLVRLIELGGEAAGGDSRLSVVSKIVKASNSQNAITKSDLYSNDPQQIALERAFRARGYQYLRKSETAREAALRPNGHLKPRIEMVRLAQAIGSCLHDGFVHSIGTGQAFRPDEPYYDEFFGLDINVLLNAFWLHRLVLAASRRKESKQSAPAKWLVLFDTWQRLPLSVREESSFHSTLHRSADEGLEVAVKHFLKLRFADMRKFHSASQRNANPRTDLDKFFKGPGRTKLLEFEGGSMPQRSLKAFEKVLVAVV